MEEEKYWRLNYEISSWLPKDSIWHRKSNGKWYRQDGSHEIGAADGTMADGHPYWFALLLEQETTGPSGGKDYQGKRILSEVVQANTWVEVDSSR